MEHQLIVLLIFGAVGLFNWMVRKGSKGGGSVDKGSPPFTATRRPRPTQVESTESEEERTRRFLEALGVPGTGTTTAPPRRIVRPVQQPASQALPRTGNVIPRQQAAPAPRKSAVPPLPVPPLPQRPAPTPPSLPATVTYEAVPPENMDVAALAAAFSSAAVPSSDVSPSVEVLSANLAGLQSLLKSPSSIRTAMILKEVLGPPKSLQGAGGIPGLL